MRDFKIIGHRGACAREPENTLRSILRAIADGADMVEIDVHYAAGEILVIHDNTVDRTTSGSGSIHHFFFAEIRELNAGLGERIPILAEVIEVTRGKCPLNKRKFGRRHKLFELAKQIQATGIHPHLRLVSRTLIETAHAKNLRVLPFTVKTSRQLQKLLEFGADGCFANDPKWARELMK